MTQFFSFDASDLSAATVAVLKNWTVWQEVYADLVDLPTASDVAELLADLGYFEQATSW